MITTTKDLNPEADKTTPSPDASGIIKTKPEEKKEKGREKSSAPAPEITESLKPIEGVKTWKITLLDVELIPKSYTHPATRKKFLKGVPVYTTNKALAEDCENNAYFDVQG